MSRLQVDVLTVFAYELISVALALHVLPIQNDSRYPDRAFLARFQAKLVN